MSIYKYTDFRKYLKDLLNTYPKKGYGQLSRLAEYLGINSAYLSQIFQGTKSFSPEQALATTEFFHLGEREAEYFLLLVQLDRAGTSKLKNFLTNKLNTLRKSAEEIKNRVTADTHLTDDQRATFYSDWSYSAVRQATAIPGNHQIERIAEFINLDPQRVAQVLKFLVETGLCEAEGGKYKIGARRTHLESGSPFIKLHHQNWRMKAIESVYDNWEPKMHFSSPMTLAVSDAKKIRAILLEAIEQMGKIADNSTSEEMVCLNIDWFRVNKKSKSGT